MERARVAAARAEAAREERKRAAAKKRAEERAAEARQRQAEAEASAARLKAEADAKAEAKQAQVEREQAEQEERGRAEAAAKKKLEQGQKAASGKDWAAAIAAFEAGVAIPDKGGGDRPVWQQLRSELGKAQQAKAAADAKAAEKAAAEKRRRDAARDAQRHLDRGQQFAADKDWTAAIEAFEAGQAIPDEGGGDLPVWQQLRSGLEDAQRGKAAEVLRAKEAQRKKEEEKRRKKEEAAADAMWTNEFFIWEDDAVTLDPYNISVNQELYSKYRFLRIRRWAEKVNDIIKKIKTLWGAVERALDSQQKETDKKEQSRNNFRNWYDGLLGKIDILLKEHPVEEGGVSSELVAELHRSWIIYDKFIELLDVAWPLRSAPSGYVRWRDWVLADKGQRGLDFGKWRKKAIDRLASLRPGLVERRTEKILDVLYDGYGLPRNAGEQGPLTFWGDFRLTDTDHNVGESIAMPTIHVTKQREDRREAHNEMIAIRSWPFPCESNPCRNRESKLRRSPAGRYRWRLEMAMVILMDWLSIPGGTKLEALKVVGDEAERKHAGLQDEQKGAAKKVFKKAWYYYKYFITEGEAAGAGADVKKQNQVVEEAEARLESATEEGSAAEEEITRLKAVLAAEKERVRLHNIMENLIGNLKENNARQIEKDVSDLLYLYMFEKYGGMGKDGRPLFEVKSGHYNEVLGKKKEAGDDKVFTAYWRAHAGRGAETEGRRPPRALAIKEMIFATPVFNK